MWDRWKKKVSNLFDTDSFVENELNKQENKNQKLHAKTKIMYQYPKHNSFRFPVIPDEVNKKTSSELPAYQRKINKRTRMKSKGETEQIKRTHKNNEIHKNDHKIPFKPSQVASPIYGFQKRKKDKEIENIPTFIRKQQEKENLIIEQPIENSREIKTENKEISFSNSDKQDIINYDKKPDIVVNQDNSYKSKNKQIPLNVMTSDNENVVDNKRITTQNQNNRTSQEQQINRPPSHLLNDPELTSSEDLLWVQTQQQLLERTLKYFNVKAKVVNATQGPSVTRFEVQPELGVKVSKVRNLSDDIKLNMAAKDIRIEAPIPGKNTIGIEIPNPKAQMVGLQEIFNTDSFKESTSPLTIALGLTIEGLPLITNISKMPHGLIAGATGSGKSVCINTILISLLYKASHEEVKFLLIDPKMVELAPYNGIPHLLAPVITDVKAATAALKWAVNEMEERYEKFVTESVRDIKRFNEKKIKQNLTAEKMPYIVIIIDELADLMMVSPQDVENAICRIAQKARACGIHLLLATQRPSVDVITGLIKANIPTRIAFSVSSQVDSRTIIDTNGADKLLGKGDMLFVENGSGKSLRLQGPFVSDEEIERVTSYARTIAQPNYLFQQEQLLKEMSIEEEDDDELLEEVIQFILVQGNASTSLLQRKFRIGYNRAARLVDTLQNKGIISEQNGTKPREVLLSRTQLEDNLSN